MRKRMYFVAWWMALAFIRPLAASGDIAQDVMRLPLPARNFINRHFIQPKISYVKIDKGDIFHSRKYEVLLTDRTEIEFDQDGNWIEVDCKLGAVPLTLIPEYVQVYINTYFPNEHVTQIERKKGLEVELSNDFTLIFNQTGELIDVDD